jgi:hypothetical protein
VAQDLIKCRSNLKNKLNEEDHEMKGRYNTNKNMDAMELKESLLSDGEGGYLSGSPWEK